MVTKNFRIYRTYIKRILDLALSVIAIIILSPLFIFIALLVRMNMGSPIIYTQERPGMHEKIFKMYKFRTMTEAKDQYGNLLPDKDRLTRFGAFLRSTSLDELPELFNIVKGDMSIVGPRPLLVQYLSLYNAEQRRRHNVRPGLTGLAQVNGRNTLSWFERFSLDVEYVDNISFLIDCKIIFLTMKKVLVREGISSDTSVTMEPFQGNDKDSVGL